MAATLDDYLGLITSQHAGRPKFMALCALLAQYAVDRRATQDLMLSARDIDSAVGTNLDDVGKWVGASRNLPQSLAGTTSLIDEDYRLLLKAVVAISHWDGSVPGAYTIWNTVFAAQGFQILIQDNQDQTMFYVFNFIAGISDVFKAMIQGGYIAFQPGGVQILGYFVPSGFPYFGLNQDDSFISGLNKGYLVVPLS